MKMKKVFLSLVLCFCSVFAVLGLTGCKDVNLSTLKENFEKLDETFASYNEIFVEGECEGLETRYLVASYGKYVDEKIYDHQDGYDELLKLYNFTLVTASDYIENNRGYILGLEEKELSKDSKNALKVLNESLVDYINFLPEFIRARESMIEYFSKYASQTENSNLKNLLQFKKVYGALVKKNVTLSINSAKMVETTKIFDLLKQTHPTAADTETVKEYIRAKMLPVYSEMKITEIANNMNWSAQKTGDCKERIDTLIQELDSSFSVFKENFISKVTNKVLTKSEMQNLFDLADQFFVETDAYYQALYGLNLSNLAVNFDNELAKYLKTNKLAEVYLDKLEQFVGHTLNAFINSVCQLIYSK